MIMLLPYDKVRQRDEATSARFNCSYNCLRLIISLFDPSPSLRYHRGVVMVFAGIGYEMRCKYRRHNDAKTKLSAEKQKQDTVTQRLMSPV